MINNINPFEELPEGLVDEMLSNSRLVAGNLAMKYKEISNKKGELRRKLENLNLLKNYNDLSSSQAFPTSAGVDGSYTIERMLASDFACVAAVAVEGLTPPNEKRYWPKPRYFSNISIVKHNDDTSQVLRGISAGLEIHLAVKAPHDVVFLDGSMKTPIIFLNNATEKILTAPPELRDIFLYGKDAVNEDSVRFPGFKDMINNLEEILKSPRSDKVYVAVPKYTTRNELCQILGYENYEDRGLLNFILQGGEYIGPLDSTPDNLHISTRYIEEFDKNLVEDGLKDRLTNVIKNFLPSIKIIYFRPYNYSPVFRLEIPNSVSANKSMLSLTLEAIRMQTVSSAIMEPYPLYLADRMVKHLSTAIPAIKNSALQQVAQNWNDNLSNIFMAMHSFRTEGGWT
ncbi:DNA double-strand break repair nuclease NurA [Caldisericum sp.]|jgi:hypothetical protein|uniref:DNA double-strand break repair nuclease NurA n=1 Tax=Caldisericum sp. TaxID=2499687 RepID=UPI003D115294